jgi:hypothetical protein
LLFDPTIKTFPENVDFLEPPIITDLVLTLLESPTIMDTKSSAVPMSDDLVPADFVVYLPPDPTVSEHVKFAARGALSLVPRDYWKYFADPYFIRAAVEQFARLSYNGQPEPSPEIAAFVRNRPAGYVSPSKVPPDQPYPPPQMLNRTSDVAQKIRPAASAPVGPPRPSGEKPPHKHKEGEHKHKDGEPKPEKKHHH